ncbi:MAG: hypothetical protein ABI716_03275 [Candidatus Saccharibacteria bacterium]
MHLPTHGRIRCLVAVVMAGIATITLSSCTEAKLSSSDVIQQQLLGRGFDQAIFLYNYGNGSGYSFSVRVADCRGTADVIGGKFSVTLKGKGGKQTRLIDPSRTDVTSYATSANCITSF